MRHYSGEAFIVDGVVVVCVCVCVSCRVLTCLLCVGSMDVAHSPPTQQRLTAPYNVHAWTFSAQNVASIRDLADHQITAENSSAKAPAGF